jgi:hypothetical protein
MDPARNEMFQATTLRPPWAESQLMAIRVAQDMITAVRRAEYDY